MRLAECRGGLRPPGGSVSEKLNKSRPQLAAALVHHHDRPNIHSVISGHCPPTLNLKYYSYPSSLLVHSTHLLFQNTFPKASAAYSQTPSEP